MGIHLFQKRQPDESRLDNQPLPTTDNSGTISNTGPIMSQADDGGGPINPHLVPTLVLPAAVSFIDKDSIPPHLSSRSNPSTPTHFSHLTPVAEPFYNSGPNISGDDLRFFDAVSFLEDDQIEYLAETFEKPVTLVSEPQSESDNEDKPPLPPRPGESAPTGTLKSWIVDSIFRTRSQLKSKSKSKSKDQDLKETTTPKADTENEIKESDLNTNMPSRRNSLSYHDPPQQRALHPPYPPQSSHSNYSRSAPPRQSAPPPSSYKFGPPHGAVPSHGTPTSHKHGKENSHKGKESVMDPLGYAPEYSYYDAMAVVNSNEPYFPREAANPSEAPSKKSSGKLSDRSTKLLKDFNLVVRDIGKGAPAAYGDLERLITTNNSHIEGIFDKLPPRMQKASKILAKTMAKNTQERDIRDARDEMEGRHPGRRSESKSRSSGAISGFTKLLDTGMVVSLLSKLKVPAVVPAAFLTPTAMASLGVFVFICALWYCFKRGRDIRLEQTESMDGYSDRLSVNTYENNSYVHPADRGFERPSRRMSLDRDGGHRQELNRRSSNPPPPSHWSHNGRPPPIEHDRRSYAPPPQSFDGSYRQGEYHSNRPPSAYDNWSQHSSEYNDRDFGRERERERDRDRGRDQGARPRERRSSRSDRRH